MKTRDPVVEKNNHIHADGNDAIYEKYRVFEVEGLERAYLFGMSHEEFAKLKAPGAVKPIWTFGNEFRQRLDRRPTDVRTSTADGERSHGKRFRRTYG